MKQLIFRHFFKNMPYTDFCSYGKKFATEIEKMTRGAMLKLLIEHQEKGATVYIISASIEEWVRPWCEKHSVRNVLATKIEVNSKGLITGRFLSKNCYGQEKINRLNESEFCREKHYLYAYGDSRGDDEMLNFADIGIYISKHTK